jgi:hypothetical protein
VGNGTVAGILGNASDSGVLYLWWYVSISEYENQRAVSRDIKNKEFRVLASE